MSRPSLRADGQIVIATASNGAITLSVPIHLRRCSGRKLVVLEKSCGARPWDAATTPLQQALARGFRWLRKLDASEFASLSDIARHENTDPSYIARMMNLTLLAPDIIEAILNDTLPDRIRLQDLSINPPILWNEQRKKMSNCMIG